MGLGRARAQVRLTSTDLHVRMGWAFDARVPRSTIHAAVRSPDVPWAIGVHTDLHGSWLVNGSAAGIVNLTLDPSARARMAGVSVSVKRLGLGLQDPEGFLAALGAPSG